MSTFFESLFYLYLVIVFSFSVYYFVYWLVSKRIDTLTGVTATVDSTNYMTTATKIVPGIPQHKLITAEGSTNSFYLENGDFEGQVVELYLQTSTIGSGNIAIWMNYYRNPFFTTPQSATSINPFYKNISSSDYYKNYAKFIWVNGGWNADFINLD